MERSCAFGEYSGAACSLLCAVGTSTAVAAPTATPVAGLSTAPGAIARATDDAMWIAERTNPGGSRG